jgi:hypothetical protein
LTNAITQKNNDIVGLEDKVAKYEVTKDQATSILCMGYDDELGNGHIYFNLPYFIIGGVIFLVIYFILKARSDFDNRKAIKGGGGLNIPFLSRGSRASPEDWNKIDENEQMPNVEKQMLAEGKNSDKGSEYNNAVNFVDSEGPKEKFKIVENDNVPKKKDNISPKERARREKLSRLAKGENVED